MTETAEAPKVETVVFLKNVRLAFPDLFVAKQYEGKGEFKYSATFLIEKGSANDTAVRAAIAKAAAAKWGEKADGVMKTIEGQGQKFCYLAGDLKAYAGFEGKMALSCKRNQKDGPVLVLDKDKTTLTGVEGRPYGGCFVNAKVQVWAQENEFGKGMRCTLVTVQYASDGEHFGGAPSATADGFEVVEDDANDLV